MKSIPMVDPTAAGADYNQGDFLDPARNILGLLQTAVSAKDLTYRLFAKTSEYQMQIARLDLDTKKLALDREEMLNRVSLENARLDQAALFHREEMGIRRQQLSAMETASSLARQERSQQEVLALADSANAKMLSMRIMSIGTAVDPQTKKALDPMDKVLMYESTLQAFAESPSAGEATQEAVKHYRATIDNKVVQVGGRPVQIPVGGRLVTPTYKELMDWTIKAPQEAVKSLDAFGIKSDSLLQVTRMRNPWMDLTASEPQAILPSTAVPGQPNALPAAGGPASKPSTEAEARMKKLGLEPVKLESMLGGPSRAIGYDPTSKQYFMTETSSNVTGPKTTKSSKISKTEARKLSEQPGNVFSRSPLFSMWKPQEDGSMKDADGNVWDLVGSQWAIVTPAEGNAEDAADLESEIQAQRQMANPTLVPQ